MRTIRGYFCWLFGHDFLCMHRSQLKDGTMTEWKCQHCDKERDGVKKK